MDEVWQVVAAVSAGVVAFNSVIAVPLFTYFRRKAQAIRTLEADVAALRELIGTEDTKLRGDFTAAIQEAVKQVGEKLEQVSREWKGQLESHMQTDSQKHGELFDLHRDLLKSVGRIEGHIDALRQPT